MSKTIRVILFFLLFILLVSGIAVGVGLYNPRAYEGLLNKLVYQNTGYQYSTREISIQLSPAKISIQGFELVNPEWSENPHLLQLGSVEISLDLKQLFNKQFPFWSADLKNADIQLVEDGQGQLNWNTSIMANQPKPKDQEVLDLKKLLSFSSISIEQAKLQKFKPNVIERFDIRSFLVQRVDATSVQVQGAGVYKEQDIEIEGTIEVKEQNSAEQILRFIIKATGIGIDLQTTGSINLQDIDGAKVSLNARSESLSQLERFLEITFPAVAPIDISLDLLYVKGWYEVSKIKLQMGENILSGDVQVNMNDSFVRANLISKKLDLSSLLTRTSVKSIEEENAPTQILFDDEGGETEIDWTWMKSINSEVNINIGEIIFGEHVLHNVSILAKLEDGVINVETLKGSYQRNDIEHPEKSIKIGPLEITGSLQPLADKTTGKDIKIAMMLAEKNVKLALQGDVNINGIEGNMLKVEAEAEALDALAKFMQTDLDPHLPAKLSANIETSMHTANITQLVVTTKTSDVSGSISLDWSDEIIKVDGKINSELFDLSPMMQEAKNEEIQTATQNDQVALSDVKIFSDDVINWNWLDAYDVNFDIVINKLIALKNIFNNVVIKIELGNGTLVAKPIQAFFADGRIYAVLELNKVGDEVKLNTQLDAININLSAFGATRESVLDGGTMDIVFNFIGQGKSLHQIMSSLDGELVAEVQKATIKNDAFEIFGADIVFELFSMLNPFMKDEKTTELECVAVKFIAKDGVLTSNNQLAVETTKMKIVGGGVVDLSTERLKIGFSPIAKKGFGVNLGSLVKFVRLGGSLSNPHLEADLVGQLKSSAAKGGLVKLLGEATSTGGLSLLAEGLLRLFKRVANSGSACNQALKDSNAESNMKSNNGALDAPDQVLVKEAE